MFLEQVDCAIANKVSMVMSANFNELRLVHDLTWLLFHEPC